MAMTKDGLIEKLRGAGVEFNVTEHAACPTAAEQAQALSGTPGVVVKNLFLQDKKKRLIILSMVESTKADLSVLSARFGTGKGGLKMASAELVEEVLKVPQGSITPLCVANVSAETVTLLLDQNLRSQEAVFVHPLVNTCTLSMAPAALEASLKVLGRDPTYIDMGADPKIDRDNPPDLAKYLPAPPAKEQFPATVAAAPAPQTPAAPAPAKAKSSSKAAPAKENMVKKHMALSDVDSRSDAIIQKVTEAMKNMQTGDDTNKKWIMRGLKLDIEMQLNAVRNAAYAAGHMAGKGEVVSFGEKRYA